MATDAAPDAPNQPVGLDLETGEAVHLLSSGSKVAAVRLLSPDNSAKPGTAQIDALAFTVVPPDGQSMLWTVAQLLRFLPIDSQEPRKGCFGFKHSMRFGEGAGIVAWGGNSQRGRVYVSLMGKGCGLVQDWPGLAAWLEAHGAVIKRADVACDDFAGESINIDWAVAQYEAGGFNAGGRQPRHTTFGDWLTGSAATKGRTLGIGNRQSGKYCRVYEKGKQLGQEDSPWVRVEVEWHGTDRVIPFDVLTRPGAYLAGAYPCLAVLGLEQSRIKTVANAASIEFEAAVAHARLQCGPLVNLMLQVFGGDQGAVVDQLRRDGMPRRIKTYSHHLADKPELLDPSNEQGFAAFARKK